MEALARRFTYLVQAPQMSRSAKVFSTRRINLAFANACQVRILVQAGAPMAIPEGGPLIGAVAA